MERVGYLSIKTLKAWLRFMGCAAELLLAIFGLASRAIVNKKWF